MKETPHILNVTIKSEIKTTRPGNAHRESVACHAGTRTRVR